MSPTRVVAFEHFARKFHSVFFNFTFASRDDLRNYSIRCEEKYMSLDGPLRKKLCLDLNVCSCDGCEEFNCSTRQVDIVRDECYVPLVRKVDAGRCLSTLRC